MLLASSSILLTADLENVSCQGSLSFFPPHTSISSSEAERRNRISAVQRLRPNGVTWFYRGVTMVSPKRSKSWLCFSCKRQLIWLMANHSHRSTSWFLAKTLGQADSFGWNEWKASCWFMRCDFTIGHVFSSCQPLSVKNIQTLAPPISPTFISRWQCKKAAAAALT